MHVDKNDTCRMKKNKKIINTEERERERERFGTVINLTNNMVTVIAII